MLAAFVASLIGLVGSITAMGSPRRGISIAGKVTAAVSLVVVVVALAFLLGSRGEP